MKLSKEDINTMVEVLRKDGVLAYPTDTIYGVCARFDHKKAFDALVECKHRPSNKAFPLMVSDVEMMKQIGVVTPKMEKVVNTFMPGPLTVVLDKKEVIEPWMNANQNTIAVRMACDASLKEVISKLGVPVYMTSANLSGEPVLESADQILSGMKVDAVVDAAPLRDKASTIVKIDDEIKVLREGPITLEEIMKVAEE